MIIHCSQIDKSLTKFLIVIYDQCNYNKYRVQPQMKVQLSGKEYASNLEGHGFKLQLQQFFLMNYPPDRGGGGGCGRGQPARHTWKRHGWRPHL
jgi:hypothetical protein